MVVEYQNQLYHVTKELLAGVTKLDGKSVLISTLGDREVISKFKNILCSVFNRGNETYLKLEESGLLEEDIGEMRIPLSKIEKIQVLEWEEYGEIEGFYIVIIFTTGNELHIEKCVA